MRGTTNLLDFFFPRTCRVCGNKLSGSEQEICITCLKELPRTGFHLQRENEVEKLFWGLMPIERATAYFYYRKGTAYGKLLYHLKYYNHPNTGFQMARCAATEIKKSDFFDGIDVIVPLPLSRKKLRRRGYNQSEYIARGISSLTGIPIDNTATARKIANETQTRKGRTERWKNVQDIFSIIHPEQIEGKHILIVDDVVTTGATLCAIGNTIRATVPNTKISIFTLAYATLNSI